MIIVQLIISKNLSELHPRLGNWFSGSRDSGNSVSEYSILKNSLGEHAPTSLR